MWQRYERGAESDRQRVAYVVGSGSHAFGYLVQIADHLFQSPLSYYNNRRAWDMAPGYEQSEAPDFSRPVTLECLLCHAGAPRPRKDTLNSFESPPFSAEAITCERCHGDSEAHLKKPARGSILNPAKLTGAVRDSICEQCHLAGEIRIPNPGKSLADFRPGKPLEQAYTVYVAAQAQGAGVKVVSHSEQLALSACARNSGGKLWCGTCHDPHAQPANPVAYYRDRCLSCHAASLDAAHAAAGRDCVACHMPSAPARDGGHTAFTDHRIRKRQPAGEETGAGTDAGINMTAWREPDISLRDRNLALALVTRGIETQSSAGVIRGYKLMNRIEKQFPEDAALMTSLGLVLLKAKQPEEALKRLSKARMLRPDYAPYAVNEAAALVSLGRTGEAAGTLERALKLDPLLLPAVELLSRVYRVQGQNNKAEELLRSSRQAMGIRASSIDR